MKISIISDVHSNLHALKAVLEHIKRQKADKIISLGDIIDYGGQPNEVVTLIRKMKITSIIGNHEQALWDEYYRSLLSDFALNSLNRTQEVLTEENFNYLYSLRRTIEFNKILFVHGMPPDDISTYFCKLSQMQLISAFNSYQNKLCFVGHSHVPAIAEFNEKKVIWIEFEGGMTLSKDYKYIINPGSVGQPRNGNYHSSYMLLDTDSLLLKQVYVKYDIEAAADQIIKNDFLPYNAERLYHGR